MYPPNIDKQHGDCLESPLADRLNMRRGYFTEVTSVKKNPTEPNIKESH